MKKRDQAYEFLKNNIMKQRWQAGDTINLSEVCSLLKMSRTPVQEALSRLAQEGYVSIVPQVGAYVRMPSSSELLERLLMRAKLEALMAEWAAVRIQEDQLKQLSEILQRMEKNEISLSQYAALNREFHQIIFEASGLEHVKKVAEQYWDYMEYTEALDLLFEQRHRTRSTLEHNMIFHALADRNQSLAGHLMENHITRAIHLLSES